MKHVKFAVVCLSCVFLTCLSFAQSPIIIDHTCTNLSRIPAGWIQNAKENLRVGYSHTSHGSQLVTGWQTFQGEPGSLFYFDSSGWGFEPDYFLNDYWGNAGGAEDLGHNGDLAWRDATIQMLNLPGNNRNVVIWSWCGGVSDNTASGISAYLNAMNQLEIQYPDVTFVYITGHLDGTGETGNLQILNNQIRDYCITHNKILFDFADIESYDPDGDYFLDLGADDGCNYNDWQNNWAQEWCAEHPGSVYCSTCECAHSEPLNCNVKGAAFWWLLARISGWDGISNNPTPTPIPHIETPATDPFGIIILMAILSGIFSGIIRRR